ncbi:MAG: hypothetical protein AAB229_02165 [Candidatus Hydrogenedentota bacterium]
MIATHLANKHIVLGRAAAAAWSVAIGMMALAKAHLAAEMSEAWKTTIHGFGKAWIPGAQGIGPYSGKETFALAAWLISWIVLHFLLRNRDIRPATLATVFLIGIGIATTLLWPPVWEPILHFFGSH